MTPDKGSGGAFSRICNGMQFFFSKFRTLSSNLINETKGKNIFKTISTRLKFRNQIKLGVF